MSRGWFGSKEAHRAAALKGWITRRKKLPVPAVGTRAEARLFRDAEKTKLHQLSEEAAKTQKEYERIERLKERAENAPGRTNYHAIKLHDNKLHSLRGDLNILAHKITRSRERIKEYEQEARKRKA